MNEGRASCCGLNATFLRRGLLLLLPLLMLAVAHFPSVAIATSADVRLQSEPEGASVFVNGRLAGATPLTVKDLPLGLYGIRIEKEGFEPLLRTVKLEKEGLKLRETLPPLATAEVDVNVKPDGAEVLLDGELQGHTPLSLSAVPVGPHELLIRKTNYNPFAREIVVNSGDPLVFKGFELDDKVMQMLNGNIAKEETRVAHYMDLGHYLFVNDHLDAAAAAYCKALDVSATKLTFGKETLPVEQRLLERLRNEDRSRLGSQIGLKETWRGKNVAEFTKIVETRRHELNEQHIKEWWWISEQSGYYLGHGRPGEADALLTHFIDVNRNQKNIPIDAATMALLGVRVKMHKLPAVQESVQTITTQYKTRADLVRQAADALFTEHARFAPKERPEALALAEKLFRLGADESKAQKNIDLQALCEYQLAIALAERGELDAAIAAYRESIGNTRDVGTREQRTQKLADCYRSRHDFADARTLLSELAQSKHEAVASKARQDLKELASVEAAGKK